MRIYLAAPFEKQSAMRGLAADLRAEGFQVEARWLAEGTESPTAEMMAQHAQHDLDDIKDADVVVVYNPTDYYHYGTGGRHVEFGYALGTGKPIVLFGGRPSNVFHTLPSVYQAPDFWTLQHTLCHLHSDFSSFSAPI
jgi:nucleoside 2-deoxyribosyltransferase